ncbi:MAG: 3-phosphoshikimate 1-carboxyvinyltransferase [Planctomycetes bacterium]|nr:3-phosphoshikimate 1-carboxyvinyltransferase [Planctomycetota bacterium]
MTPVARGTVVAPPSKSHAIRALICAALGATRGDGSPEERYNVVAFARGPLPDDVVAAVGALRALGFDVDVADRAGAAEVRVRPEPGGIPNPTATLDLGGSATALRLFAAVCSLGPGPYTLTGNAQLRRRPAGAIVEALRALGVTVHGAGAADVGAAALQPPLVVSGGPPRGGEVALDASQSSHVVSALLLIAEVLPAGLRIRAKGLVASRPYIDLTVSVMRSCGADVAERDGAWDVGPTGGYPRAGRIDVEGDWSSAAFLLAAGAATGGDVRVEGLNPDSAQADRRIVSILGDFGAAAWPVDGVPRGLGDLEWPVDVDLGDAPDLAPLFGALACLVPGTSRVRGAGHLRIKETDRIAEVVRCAQALGCVAREFPDGFEVTGPATRGATINPAGDHRLAMAFAVAGLVVPGTRIADPECVGKSYPAFWQDLAKLTGVAAGGP